MHWKAVGGRTPTLPQLSSRTGMAGRPSSILQRRLQLLSACMLWGIVISGTVNSPTRRHQWCQVNGIVGGSISLVLNLMPGEMEDKSHLDFHSRYGEGLELAIFLGGQWKRSETPDRFGQRLELPSETTVRITGLVMEDSGLFLVSVMLPPAKIWYHTFNLTVYALVPEPQIHLHKVSDTTEKCNVTLWCQVSGEGAFTTSWIMGQTSEGSEDWYQFSDNNSTLHLLWYPKLDSNIICLVSNPVDQKKDSYDLLKICPNAHQDKQLPSRWNSEDHNVLMVLILLTILGCVTYAVAIAVMCWQERKDFKHKERPAPLPIPDAKQDVEEKVPLLVNPDQENRAWSTGTESLSQRARPPPC